MQRLGFAERPRELAKIQALAAIGQADLMARYQASFARHGRVAAQILLTHQGLARRDDFLNVRHALRELLELGVVPIANENDTVATEELRFGDNDRLAAAFATVIDADLVILLSDIPHLFAEDPRQNPAAAPVLDVPIIDESIHQMAGAAGSAVGTGGMASKILAATIAVEAGIPLVIAHGQDPRIIHRIVRGEVVGTLFHPRKKLDRRRHRIGFLSRLSGSSLIDRGAVHALRGGRARATSHAAMAWRSGARTGRSWRAGWRAMIAKRSSRSAGFAARPPPSASARQRPIRSSRSCIATTWSSRADRNRRE
jgi:glutamate 5-kinase